MKKRYLLIALIILSFISLFIGATDLNPLEIFQMSDEQAKIFWSSRVPRLVSIIIAGVAMSISGLIMQQLSHNKFVSPTTAGTMDSARFGILISMMFFTGSKSFVKNGISLCLCLTRNIHFYENTR